MPGLTAGGLSCLRPAPPNSDGSDKGGAKNMQSQQILGVPLVLLFVITDKQLLQVIQLCGQQDLDHPKMRDSMQPGFCYNAAPSNP